MEESFADNTQRVDITFQNCREKGFFKQLAEGYRIICPNIFIECKNCKRDLKNKEFSRIQNRLNKIKWQFGFLVCKHIDDCEAVKTRQMILMKDEKIRDTVDNQ